MIFNSSKLSLAFLASSLIFGTVFGDEKPANSCISTKGLCTKSYPCCNSNGFCGSTFDYCGASTCVESGNYKGKKCFPLPYCKNMGGNFDAKKIIKKDDYKGDFNKYDFYFEGDGEYEVNNGIVTVKMTKAGKGVTLKSTRFVNYGKISADIKTSRGGGVVTAFITMSQVKDEIDFEWVGKDLEGVQTNWFAKGRVPDQKDTHFKRHDVSDTYNDFHNYAIDFNPDRIQWFVDGKMIREQKNNMGEYTDTPAQFSFGVWDGGAGAEGTREWAGGYIDWKSDEVKKYGGYFMQVKNFKVECTGSPTSKDSDFVFDEKNGQMDKETAKKKKSSLEREGGGEEGDQHAFDTEAPNQNENGSSTSVLDSRRPVKDSSASPLSFSLISLAIATLLNFN